MTYLATRRILAALFSLTLACLSLGLTARAQDKPADAPKPAESSKPVTDYHQIEQDWENKLHTTDCSKMPNRTIENDCRMIHYQTRTIYLKNVSQQNEANEILVAVRNMADPSIKVFLIASQNAITIGSYPQDLERIEAYIHALDRPHTTYRLTYTITESDAGKRIGVQHFSMVTATGQRTQIKEGSKVPVATGSYSTSDKASQEQFTYLDVGMNFDATLMQMGDNLQLNTKVEQSAVASMQTISGVQEPVIRQSIFTGIANLTPGKPVTIGAIDVPGSTRHLDIEVLAEPLQ